MADVTYNTSSFPELVKTLEALIQLSADKLPLILLAYKQRDVAERTLWDMLNIAGVVLTKVGEERGMTSASWSMESEDAEEGQGPVEIWIGRALRRPTA